MNMYDIRDFGARSDGETVNTAAIQKAIDTCTGEGGGTVTIAEGTYVSATLFLKSNVTLEIAEGAVLLGSTNIDDYTNPRRTGFIHAVDAENIGVVGKGKIDGVDCKNPKGEEGFRGPHCIGMHDCSGITIKDITIDRSGNWAFDCKRCSDATITNLRVIGGHDGFDADCCSNFTWEGCDFRCGDDCIAGSNNKDWVFRNCYFNSSCHGMRISCINLEVSDCTFQGPGEHAHKISGRNNMKGALIHFAPQDRSHCNGTHLISDNWLIRNCKVDMVDAFFLYDNRTLWQEGRPMGYVCVQDCKITNVYEPFVVVGDMLKQFKLRLERLVIELRDSGVHNAFIDLRTVGALRAHGLKLKGVNLTHVPLSAVDVGSVEIGPLEELPF